LAVAAEVAVVAAAAAVAAVLALPEGQTVVARPAADVFLHWTSTPEPSILFSKFSLCCHSSASSGPGAVLVQQLLD
jgi:hypothetical protein